MRKLCIVLANPAFAGRWAPENTAKGLRVAIVGTEEAGLLFASPSSCRLFEDQQNTPPSSSPTACFSARATPAELNTMLVEERRAGTRVFGSRVAVLQTSSPYSTAVLLFAETTTSRRRRLRLGSTTWKPTAGPSTTSADRSFCEQGSDLPPPRRSATTGVAQDNLANMITRWRGRDSGEHARARTAKAIVPETDVAGQQLRPVQSTAVER